MNDAVNEETPAGETRGMADRTPRKGPRARPLVRKRWWPADGAIIVHRNLLALRRNPSVIAASLAAPLGMVAMFGYVFGNALSDGSATDYRRELIPAVFVLVAATGAVMTAGSTAMEVQNGVTERLKSLPMRRIAVPFGLAGSQLVLSVVSLTAMALLGLAVGWRIEDGAASALAGFVLLLLFGYGLTWAGVFLGLAIRTMETIQQLAPLVFAFVMLSNAFVPTAGMPTMLRTLAEWNPFSAAISAARSLFGNAPAPDGPLPLAHPVLTTVIWSVALITLFAPLTARHFAKAE
ncbi:ABC transporter permease [Streptomyces johnsoniae]|uniref:Transport permease protein n=1 Tax=Streptomyces johnsoniae TaxID=3075532 RepID=A0ABU2S8L6_9ACTN|nr:ABC transporter permease [Streptomyces sp. DSM 41886]MDT0445332.1 ABC transporter permease [Streptomyces sp. DSM 41886]